MNMDAEKKIVAYYFMMEGHSKSTIYDLKRKDNYIQAESKVESGCRAKKMNSKKVKLFTARLIHKDGISPRSLAKSLKVSPFFINYAIKNKINIRYRKKNTGS